MYQNEQIHRNADSQTDTHRQNFLAKAPLPVTVKQIRSYLGGYQTDFRCKSEMSHFLTVLEEYTISKNHQKN